MIAGDLVGASVAEVDGEPVNDSTCEEVAAALGRSVTEIIRPRSAVL